MSSTVHHARLFVQPSIADKLAPNETLVDWQAILPSVVYAGDTEVSIRVYAELAIRDVREIIETASHTPATASTRTICIVAGRLRHEAQHALLKIIEEPPRSTRFVLVLPDTSGLLATLYSRLQPESTTDVVSSYRAVWNDFCARSYADRLDYVARITKSDSKERDKTKDRAHIEQRIAPLRYGGWEAMATDRSIKSTDRRTITDCLIRTAAPGASVKLLLEEVALTVPRTTHGS